MLIPILIGIAVLIAVLAVIVTASSADFRIARSTTIAAPASAVFPQVDTLRNWEAWSPWAKIDPSMKTTYDGPPSGNGASYHWRGNNKVGEGRMTVIESRPSELVQMRLEFLRPFKQTNTADFVFTPNGNNTDVTWSMSGKKNAIMKTFGFVCNMDKLIGRDFEKGLAAMKAQAEIGR